MSYISAWGKSKHVRSIRHTHFGINGALIFASEFTDIANPILI